MGNIRVEVVKTRLATDARIRTICAVLQVMLNLIAIAIVWHFRHGH